MITAPRTKFWLVWCPTGHRPPSHRHTSVESAQREAGRLAALHTGQEFYVVESIGVAALLPSWTPTTTPASYPLDDDNPF